MPDISTSTTFSNGETVTAAIMNSIIPSCTIQASFVSSKPLVSTLGNSDAIFGVSASNNLQQILYSNLQAQILSNSVGASQNGVYNLLINGDGLINQRSPSASIAATGYTALDRWKWAYLSSASRATVIQVSPTTVATLPFVSGGPSSAAYFKVTVPSATGTVAAGDLQSISQFIENNIVAPVCQGPISVGFIYNTNFSGVITLYLRDSTQAHSYVVPITLTGDSAWHSVTVQNITGLGSQSLNLGPYGGSSMDVGLTLLAGSTFQTGTTGSWVAGNFLAANTQGNFMASASNFLNIAQFRVNPGATIVPYYSEPFPTQFIKCQRYYWTSYAYGTFPGAATSLTGVGFFTQSAVSGACSVVFPGPLRNAPVYSATAGNGNLVVYSSQNGTINSVTVSGGADVTLNSATVNNRSLSLIQAASGFPAAASGFSDIMYGQVVADVDY